MRDSPRPDARVGRALLLVLGITAAVSTAGIATIPFYTRGEPREALVVREMVEGRGWVSPLRNGADLSRKPPFFHWLAAGISLAVGRVDETTVRMPSALASVAAAGVVWVWARASGTPVTAALTALVTVTTIEWLRSATVARVDMVYTALLVTALLALDRLGRGAAAPRVWSWVLWTAAACATLTKGPIALVLVVGTLAGIALVDRSAGVWRRARPMAGMLTTLTIVGAWFGLAAWQRGGDFVAMVVGENLHHLAGTARAGTGHAHGMAYLVGAGALGFLPWTPFLPLAVAALRRRWDEPSVRLAGIWTGLILGIHLLASAKRSVYLLPAFPALGFLVVAGGAAAAADSRMASFSRRIIWFYGISAILLALVAVAVAWGVTIPAAFTSLLHPRDRAGLETALAAAAQVRVPLTGVALATLSAAPVIVRAARRATFSALVAAVAGTTAGIAVAFQTFVHPAIARAASLDDFMATVTAVVGPEEALYFADDTDHGAAFYAGRRIPPIPAKELATTRGYVLIWEREWMARAAAGRLPPPLKVSRARLPKQGHLLLLALPGGERPPGSEPGSETDAGAASRVPPPPGAVDMGISAHPGKAASSETSDRGDQSPEIWSPRAGDGRDSR